MRRMSYLSSLTKWSCPLVLDTSVLINLCASACGEKVLKAIPNDIIVPKVVAGELEHETSYRNGHNGFLHGMVSDGVVTVADMTDAEYEVFEGLICGSPCLDDGEASTIAIALSRGAFPVIDERKGRGRAIALMKGQEPGWSLDILRHPCVIDGIGDELAANALYLALRDGRMRVSSDHADHVISLIGEDRSVNCTCLPGYRERFGLRQGSRRPDEASTATA